MNKIYRVVWNKATQTWAAVCEYAKAQGKSSGSDVVGEMSDKRMGGRFAYTMVMSGLLIATGQVAYAATVADGTGLNAIVIQGASSTATATGADSLAAGTNAAADGNSALAIGTDSKATGAYATAVGANVTAGGLNSITIGRSNNVTGGYTTVIGSGNIPKDGKGLDAAGGIVDVKAADTITATHSSIIGKSNQIAVSSVIGTPPPYAAVLTDVQVQGNNNIINRGHAYVFGSNNTINTNASNMELESVVAVGRQNTVSGNNSLAVGRLNTVAGGSALAVGINSQALGTDGIAIGNKAYASTRENSVAIGGLTHAGQFGTALGARTSVEGDQGAAVATGAVVKGARAVAVGSYSFAGPEDAVALGHNTAATGSRAVAMGAGSVVSGARSGAWGIATNGGQPQNNTTDRSFVGGTDSYAIGNKNIIGDKSSDSFVLGNNVKLGATGASIAITNVAGRDGTTKASTRTNAVTYTGATAITGAVALGSDTSVTVDNGVALGKGSVASTAAGQAGTDPLSAKDATASAGVWTATHAAVSVGNGTTVTRQITSVAAGTQDTDAVNVAQLKAAGFKLNATHAGGGESASIADDKIQNGETLTVDAGNNIKVTHTANTVSIATKDDVTFTSVTAGTGDNQVVLNNDGVNVGGNTYISNAGLNANGKKVTNVADGTIGAGSKDAINGGQLQSTIDTLNTSITAAKTHLTAGDNTTLSGTGTAADPFKVNVATANATVTRGNVTVADDDKNKFLTAGDVAAAINGSEKTSSVTHGSDAVTVTADAEDTNGNTLYTVDVSDKTKTSLAKADSAVQSIKVKANGNDVTTLDQNNNTLEINQGDNITVSNDNGKVKVALNKDLTGLNSVQSNTVTANAVTSGTGDNQVVLNNDGVNVGGNTYISNAGLNANGKKVTNVADGTIGAGSKDAINGGQLQSTIDTLNTSITAAKTHLTAGDNTTLSGTGTAADPFKVNVATANATVTRGNVTVADDDKNKFLTAGDVAAAINGSEKTSSVTHGSDAVTVTAGAEDTNGNTLYTVDVSDKTKTSLAKADSAVQSIKVKANGNDVTTLDQNNNTLEINQGDNITVSNDNGKVKVALNKDLTGLNSVQSNTVTANAVTSGTGDNQVVLNNDGVNVGGNTYISNAGLNANGKKVTNVADGTIGAGSKDAINGGQLQSTIDTLNTSITAAKTHLTAGDNTTLSGTGTAADPFKVNVATANATVTRGNVTVADDDKNKFLTAGDVAAAINGSEKTSSVTHGSDAVTVTAGAEDTNGNTLYTVDVSDKTKTSLAKADSAVQSIKVKANGNDVTTLDQNNNTLEINQGDNITVSNDNGKVKVALNKDLTGLNSVQSNTVTANAVTSGTGDNQVVLNNDGVNVGGNTYISDAGLNANNKKVSNVANGDVSATSKDAINGSQLYQAVNNINTSLKGAANALNNKINRNNREARAGIAGSNAAAALPQVYQPGKSMVAASAGTFKGEGAVALGYSRSSDNGKVILKLQGNANTRGDFGAGVGVGYQW